MTASVGFSLPSSITANRVLRLVAAMPGCVVEGVDADELKTRFLCLGTSAQFGAGLTALVRNGQLDVVPGSEPPRLRLTPAAVGVLTQQFDEASAKQAVKRKIDDQERPSSPACETPVPRKATGVAGPEPALPVRAPPRPARADSSRTVAAAPEPDNSAVTQAEPHMRPPRFSAGGPSSNPEHDTEYALRNALLNIFASENAATGTSIPLDALRQLWISAGHSAEQLSDALGIVCRDGELESARRGFQDVVTLTRDGDAYLRGRSPPPALTQQWPPRKRSDMKLNTLRDGPLMRHLIRQFSKTNPENTLDELLAGWKQSGLPVCSLYHGLDLLLRDDFISLTTNNGLGLKISKDGYVFRKRASALSRRLDTRRALKSAERVDEGKA